MKPLFPPKALIAALALLPGILLAHDARAQYRKGPYITHVTYTGATVQWESFEECAGVLEYGEDLTYGRSITEDESGTMHRIRLPGLSPSTTYFYSACCGEDCAEGDLYYFTTRLTPCEDYDFIAYGDTRGATQWGDEFTRHRDVLDFIDSNFDALFLLGVGDYVYAGENLEQWQFWFESGQEFLVRLPFFPTIGNHDYEFQRYTGETNQGLLNYDQWFDLPPGPNPLEITTYYAFRQGPVLFVLVDGYKDFAAGSAQHVWIENTLFEARSDPNVLHIVMAVHQPPYGLTWFGPNEGLKEHVVPLAEMYGVKLFLAGHEHSYQRVLKDGVQYVVVGNGGAMLDGLNEILPLCRLVIHPDPDMEFIDTCHYGALLVEVRGDVMKGFAYTIGGELIDQFEVTGYSYKTPDCTPDLEEDEMEEVAEDVEEEDIMEFEVMEDVPEPDPEPSMEPEAEPAQDAVGDDHSDVDEETGGDSEAGCGCAIIL